MEFLKHEINEFTPDTKNESSIRRSAELYTTTNQVFKLEREDITRQRLMFTAIVSDHYDVLFNGTSNERAPLWEEIRLFMIENGAVTLLDKDWKYTASCYWQNIRKESIRRMAKMKLGMVKQARPGQLELDRLVSIIIEKRGPGSLENVIKNYGQTYIERESGSGSKCLDREDDDMVQEKPSTPLISSNHSNGLSKQLRNSASPDVFEEQNNQQFNQSPLDQIMKNTSMKTFVQNNQQQHQSSPSTTHISGTLSQKLSQNSSITTDSSSTNENQLSSPSPFTSSQHLGISVTKTHSQLIAGGHSEMAIEFETQLKQLINGYKAWMFDQLFQQQQGETEDESSIGFQQRQLGNNNNGGGNDIKRPRL
ncbi:hypothetical protein ACQ4LE_009064 [Meloidogyne hapla]|uniref:Uncharacterized protein n=1 Tax=Meloidogyne hapla TaxID=6305 RepID=A0A1I8BHF1_MELHA